MYRLAACNFNNLRNVFIKMYLKKIMILTSPEGRKVLGTFAASSFTEAYALSLLINTSLCFSLLSSHMGSNPGSLYALQCCGSTAGFLLICEPL